MATWCPSLLEEVCGHPQFLMESVDGAGWLTYGCIHAAGGGGAFPIDFSPTGGQGPSLQPSWTDGSGDASTGVAASLSFS